MSESSVKGGTESLSYEKGRASVLADYRLAVASREASLIGRREVLTGKAKFGIFGDGKELPQIAWAKVFKAGDFRSGYYRDQTFMMAIGALSTQEFFASLYADTNHENEPASAGRQMNGHFATQSLDADGNWKNLSEQKNSSADISPTAGQMPRLVGLAEASKHYRNNKSLKDLKQFSINGNEIAWGTIGNASTSEGPFFEAINAAGVLQIPMVISIWDDEYGISVHSKYQTTKENISEILKGFQRDDENAGYEILRVKAWDYIALIDTYEQAEKIARIKHIPVMVHVTEVTQPQGHSTSGSHERYKNEQRLTWEANFDCLKKMREFIVNQSLATEEELLALEKEAKKETREAKAAAWKNYIGPIKAEIEEASLFLTEAKVAASNSSAIVQIENELKALSEPLRRDGIAALRKTLRYLREDTSGLKERIHLWLADQMAANHDRFGSHLYSESDLSPLAISAVEPEYNADSEEVDARIILRDNFDRILSEKPEVMVFGEDSGKIGDVNQGLEGLQDKHGESRVYDTGIREATILGQGIGMAMRGLRPIAEIQYLDYLLYALQVMSDDLATLHYRSKGRQKAPVIIRTRGHRLEGVWHSGSPMGAIINALRGVHVLVPRNMTQAAGFYNTMLESDDPALIVECLNGYRLKEKMPSNLADIRTALGKVETLKEGSDITVVSYGSTLRIVMEAAKNLAEFGIAAEVIDAQSLLPFDIDQDIALSVQKTNRLLVVDEDVPGGASAYILQKVVDEQNAYVHLDSKPQCLSAKAHRPAYGSDGDYFSKPSVEDVFDAIYSMMHESNPEQHPAI